VRVNLSGIFEHLQGEAESTEDASSGSEAPRSWYSSLLVLLGDHVEDATEFHQRLFSGGHQGVATGDGGHFGNPRADALPIEHDLVGVEAGMAPLRD
jgi:hypothetical protein